MSKAQDQIKQMTKHFISKLEESIEKYVNDPNPEHHPDFNQDDGFSVVIGIHQVTNEVARHFRDQGYETEIQGSENGHTDMLHITFSLK